ncbi:hypothetical protein AB0J86_00405 [Micromonospora sp. NPDC049559]|uniref:hypothetical protein n=1 Tax=Micromonospora sp. NPDC049559 TaxID=3155923 RepID=UPI00341DF8AB
MRPNIPTSANTSTSTSTSAPTSTDAIAQVTTGMRVVDADGNEVGTVLSTAPGDPNAVAAQNPPGGTGMLSGKVPHTEDGDEPEVPADLAARLLRTGYLRVDGKGLLARDLYVAADQIARVNQDVVELTVPRTMLATREA